MTTLNKVKDHFFKFLQEEGIAVESLKFIREISLEELSQMDYFEGNSDKKPKNFKELEKKYDEGDFHSHCDYAKARVPCVEVSSNKGNWCLSKTIFSMLQSDKWETKFSKQTTEDHLLCVIRTGDQFSNAKINREINAFFNGTH